MAASKGKGSSSSSMSGNRLLSPSTKVNSRAPKRDYRTYLIPREVPGTMIALVNAVPAFIGNQIRLLCHPILDTLALLHSKMEHQLEKFFTPFNTATSAEKFFSNFASPMNLMIIEQRLECRRYKTLREVETDVELLFSNAVFYYTKRASIERVATAHVLAAQAKTMLTMACIRLREWIRSFWETHCGRCGYRSGSNMHVHVLCKGDCGRSFHFNCVNIDDLPSDYNMLTLLRSDLKREEYPEWRCDLCQRNVMICHWDPENGKFFQYFAERELIAEKVNKTEKKDVYEIRQEFLDMLNQRKDRIEMVESDVGGLHCGMNEGHERTRENDDKDGDAERTGMGAEMGQQGKEHDLVMEADKESERDDGEDTSIQAEGHSHVNSMDEDSFMNLITQTPQVITPYHKMLIRLDTDQMLSQTFRALDRKTQTYLDDAESEEEEEEEKGEPLLRYDEMWGMWRPQSSEAVEKRGKTMERIVQMASQGVTKIRKVGGGEADI